MERPPDKGTKEVDRGTTFVLRKKRQEEEISWKRKSLQGCRPRIALYYRKQILSDIKSVLTDVGGEKLLQQFTEGCFGHLLRFIGGTSCSKALHELMSREITLAGARDDELWFRIGKTNIRFAPAEYALVTGLCFGSSSFDPLGTHKVPSDGVFYRLCSGQCIHIKELWDMFNRRRLMGPPEDYLKVAHVLALHLMALGYETTRMVERWVWALVDDLEAWNEFPWGAYTYQALMYYVNNVPKQGDKEILAYHFYGPVWALQIWAYEAIPYLGKKSALVTEQVTVPRCLNWSFPRGRKDVPKHLLERKLHCFVTLEPSDEEKRQPYWLSVQTEQPLGVPYASGQGRKQGLQVATVASLSPPRPRRSSVRTPIVESSLGEPGGPVEVPSSDDRDPEPSARPSRKHVYRRPDLLNEARLDRIEEKLEKLLKAREVDDQVANRVKADEKKEQSFDGGSSSMHISGMLNIPTAPEDTFHSEEQCEVPMNDQRLDSGHGRSFSNQEDPAIPNEESRSRRDGPIRHQSESTERAEIRPPRAGEVDEPELLALPSSSKRKKKKKSSRRSKHKSRSPSSNVETSDDEGSEASSDDERQAGPSSSKAKKKKKKKSSDEESNDDEGSESSSGDDSSKVKKKKKKKKKKSSRRSKHKSRSPSSSEETSDDEGSESSSGEERRRRTKRGKRKKRERSESSSSENSDSDRHWRRRNKRKRRHGSGRRHRHRHRSVPSSD